MGECAVGLLGTSKGRRGRQAEGVGILLGPPGMWVILPRKGLAPFPAHKARGAPLLRVLAGSTGVWLPRHVWQISPASSDLVLILGFTCSLWLGLGEKPIMAAWAAIYMFKPHSSFMLWALEYPHCKDGETEAQRPIHLGPVTQLISGPCEPRGPVLTSVLCGCL